jgi:hypothetical protein
LLEWVDVPSPFDHETDFISPEQDALQPGEQSNFSFNFDYNTFNPNGLPPGGIANGFGFVDGNPSTWTNPGQPDVSWNPNFGQWQNTPGSSQTNNFWTNYVSIESFRPPHSFRSGIYRNGLINLNSIKNNRVFQSLMYGFSTTPERPGSGAGAFWVDALNSRRGYVLPLGAAGVGVTRLHPNLDEASPTQFGGVFESPHGSDIAPLASMRKTPIEGTLMRPNGTTPDRPLFQRVPNTVAPAASHEKSVVHQQLGVSRLSNLSAGQSNVFAIWVTVGLFEVDANTLTVGKEVGIDSGQVRRYKGFFIIDRSKPVMFEPGKENNVGNVVQVSRIIN